MKTLIDTLCKQLTDVSRTLDGGSCSAKSLNTKFKALVAVVEAYGYRVEWSVDLNRFYAEFDAEKATALGIPEYSWPEAALEAHEAAKAAEAAVIPCPHNRTGWCETCAST